MKNLLILIMAITSAHAFADTYLLDPVESRVEWKAGKKIGSFHNGDIKIKNGKVETDAKGSIKTLDIVIDMKTIANDDLKSKPDYQAKLVNHLSSEDFFKVDQFPESTFTLKSISPVKGKKGEYLITGDLTMIGKKESVTFPATLTSEKGVLSGKATLTIERLKWGLQYGSGSIFKSLTADKIINDTFEIKLNLVAKKN